MGCPILKVNIQKSLIRSISIILVILVKKISKKVKSL